MGIRFQEIILGLTGVSNTPNVRLMIKRNISFTKSQMDGLRASANAEESNVGDVVRRAVDRFLSEQYLTKSVIKKPIKIDKEFFLEKNKKENSDDEYWLRRVNNITNKGSE